MAQLQTLEIAFSDKKEAPTELTTAMVNNLITAISTPKDGSSYGITHSPNGTSLLSGFVTPANGGSISESNQYILLQNGVTVLGDIQLETYRLNTGGYTRINEGKELQIYCLNADNQNVSMQSMVVWISIDFSQRTKDAVVTDEDIRAQFNVKDWKNTQGEIWRGTLTDRSGLLKITTSANNFSWYAPVQIQAYPATIDDDPDTTDAYREQRLTDAISVDAYSIAVTGAVMTSAPATLEPGRLVNFTLTRLLPTDNTKEDRYPLSEATYKMSANVGSFENGRYKVPEDEDEVIITCTLSYMGQQLSFSKTYQILATVISTVKNPEAFAAFKEALQLDDTVTSINNIDAAGYSNAQVMSAVALFQDKKVTSFRELRYFSRVTNLVIPEGDNTYLTALESPTVATISGTGTLKAISSISPTDLPNLTTIEAGNLFLDNTELLSVSFPKLSTVRCTTNNIFKGCTELTTVSLPAIATIVSDTNRMFESCEALTSIDLNGVKRFSCSTANYMFKGCKLLSSLNLWELGNFICDGDIAMFEGCESIASISLPSVQRLSSTNGSITLFKGCISLDTIDISALTQITCSNGKNSLFEGCTYLSSINLGKLATIRCADNRMFYGCTSLEGLSLSAITDYNISSTDYICSGCTQLVEVSMPISAVNLKGACSMFNGCSQLKTVSLPNLATIKCSTNAMFTADVMLEEISLPIISLDCGTNMMFVGCANLQTINLESLQSINYRDDGNRMFLNCTSLTSISFPALKSVVGTQGGDAMFYNLVALTKVDMPVLENWQSGYALYPLVGTSIQSINFPSLRTLKAGSSVFPFAEIKASGVTVNLPNLEAIIAGEDNRPFYNLKCSSITLPKLKEVVGSYVYLFRFCTCLEISMPKIESILTVRNEIFSYMPHLQSLNFGRYSENSQPLILSGDMTNMFQDTDTSFLKTEIESSELDNPITSRITGLEGKGFLKGMTFDKIAFPHLENMPESPAITFDAKRIKIG